MEHASPWRALTSRPGEPLRRLDLWLAFKLEGVSRKKAQRLIDGGHVTVDGQVLSKGSPIEAGAQVCIWVAPDPSDWVPRADAARVLDVVYRDDALLVVNKPSGVPSVPLGPDEPGTLAGMVVARFPECARVFRSPGDGGLLQRLDRGTSGLVLVARRQEVLERLVECQAGGGIEKRYLALVPRGEKKLPGVIRVPLGSAGPGAARVVFREHGRPARTELAPVRVWGEWQLVEAIILKGRRHQVRAHLAGAGFPIAGDALYGNLNAVPGLDRLFLHASGLRLPHPVDGRRLELTSPLPDSLAGIIGSD